MQDLADFIGVSVSYIHKIENGVRSPTEKYLEIINPEEDSFWFFQIEQALENSFSKKMTGEIMRKLKNALRFYSSMKG